MTEPQGITKISVQGFKSLYEKAEVEIRPLTILAGANSSGKSSIMQPLLLMKQTLEAFYDTETFKLDGPNVWFTGDKQFLSNLVADVEGNLIYQLVVSVELGQDRFEQTYTKIRDFLVPNKMVYQGVKHNLELRHNMPNDSLSELLGSEALQFGNVEWKTRVERCFLTLTFEETNGMFTKIFSPLQIFPIESLKKLIHELIHVQGLRGIPQRFYAVTSVSRFEGQFEPYTASVIHHWQRSDKDEDKERLAKLGEQLKELGLAPYIAAQPLNDAQIEVRVGRSMQSNEEDTVSIADVGFGVSQVLPVLVALLVAKKGQLVYIEQPELHLHPRAQVKLAQILADAANRGVQVVVETHSSLLLLGLQTLIAEGKLEPEKTILHWFTRDEEGKTTVTSQTPDENGAYGDWPEDFSEVELGAQTRFISAAERKLWEQPSGD